jgi:AcrR family transcriptional regulator
MPQLAIRKSAKRRRRKDERPGEIVEAGLAEFAATGFAATRLEDVAKRAGIAKGTIYRYFASKEALFEAAVRSRLALVFDLAPQIDAFPGTSQDLLRNLLARMYEQLLGSDMRIILRILLADGPRFPALTEFYHAAVIAQGRKLLARIVTRGIASAEFRRGAYADLPMVLMAPLLMAAVWKMNFERHEPVDAARFAAAHLDLIFEGIRKR